MPVLDYETPRRTSRWIAIGRWYASAIALKLVLLLVMAWLAVLWPWAITGNGTAMLLTYGLFAGAATILSAKQDLQKRPIARRLVFAAVLIYVAVAQVGYWACPHARYVRLGPVSVTIAGKACGNIQYNRYFEDSFMARCLIAMGQQPNRG